MKRNNLKGSLILCLAALIWGLAFVAQSKAANVPSFLINALRSTISVPFLYVLYKITNRKTKEPLFPKDKKKLKTVLLGSAVCGVFLTIATNFQQFGIAFYPDTAPVEAHAGFITALYVIIVPIMSLFIYKKLSPIVMGAAIIALVGFYFLCLKNGLGGIYTGDILVLICAFAFSLQIIAIDKYVGEIGGIRLSLLQFLVVAVLSAIMSAIFEHSQIVWKDVLSAALPILYLGIMSSGVAYTLQIVGQKYAEPAVASISMSLESVFAALGGWIIVGNDLSVNEIIGCMLVFSAIIIAQIPEFFKKNT